jgi:tRNA 2-thiocytidine biosynthesis protein TtcA
METLFLNLFHGGKLKAMPPKLLSDDGQHVVIRPLAYCKERDLAAYAEACQFPIIPCNLCGSQENLQRQAIKSMLRQWEKQFPGRVENIFAALGNVAPSHLADTGLFDFAGLGARNGGQALNWLPGGREETDEDEEGTLANDRPVEIRIPWLAVRQV